MTTQGAGGAGGAGSGDNGGAGGAGAGAGGAGDAGAGGAGGAGDIKIGGADGAQLSLYKPEGIADHLLGQDDKGTIDKLMGAYKGARDEIAKGKPQIPGAKDYQWNWSDNIKGSIAADDPAVAAFSELAHEHEFTQKQIDAIPKLFDKLAEKGIIEKPFDSAGLLTSLAPADYKGTPEERQAKGGERLTTAENWIKQLDSKVIDDKMKGELRLLTTSLDGVRLVEHFMKSGMNASVSPGGGQGGQAPVTKEALDARVADPRNDSTRHDKYNEDFAAETRRLFKQMYPD